MADLAEFLGIKPDENEEKFLIELTQNFATVMKKVAKFDKQGNCKNEQELDEHPVTQGTVKLLQDRGYDANKLDIIGFPHLAFIMRRLEDNK